VSPRTIAIGDIHGCLTSLNMLLDMIEVRETDVIVTLGDVVDRGPDTKGVLDRLIMLGRICRWVPILGNHEEMMLGARASRWNRNRWLYVGGTEALLSYGFNAKLRDVPPEHWAVLESFQNYYVMPGFAFVHAMYDPQLPFDQMPFSQLRWEHLDQSRPPARHESGVTVVVGHTPQESGEILNLGAVVDIDTSCHNRGWLTALDVTTGTVWQANELTETRELRCPLIGSG
jgi:serine/threonine protein phosphatase 1